MGEFAPIYFALTRGFVLGISINCQNGCGIYIALGWFQIAVEFKRRRLSSTKLIEFNNEWKS